jgi:micrococcal nuclease
MKRFASFSAISLLLFLSVMSIICVYGEIDKTSTVTKVIDGDTFDISTGERIRLADVDAPEYYESGYSQAKEFLSSLIDGKTVYLDVDDVYTYDYNGKGDRLVCVAYVDYDSTHLINVNKALLEEGHAVISNYRNEFNPYSWSLYLPKEAPEPTQPSSSITSMPTPTSESDLDQFSYDVLTVAVSIFAIVFVILVLVFINKKVKK